MNCVEATFTLVNFVINVGQFTLPLLFARHGWFAGVLIVLGAVICTYTANLLTDALVQLMRQGVPVPDYAELAVQAVGPGFALLAHLLSMMELLTYNCCNLIGLGKGVVAIFPALSAQAAMCLCIGVCVCLSAVPDRLFSYIALISAVAVIAVLSTCATGALELSEWERPAVLFDNLWQVPSSFAIVIFGAGTHPLLPCLLHNTRSREEFRTCLVTSWTAFALISVGFGASFYFMLGGAIQPLITENTGRDLTLETFPGGRALQRISGVWVCVKLLFSIIPVTRPVCRWIATRIGVRLPPGSGGWRCVALTTPILLAVLMSSVCLQRYIEQFESAVGAVLIGFNALTFPSITYLLICRPHSVNKKLAAWSTCVLGFVLPLSVFWL
mmetsp:Transcript_370/g.1012  ORF Transcript_370/g.1012 Transcript_370/m.1012 type:complete len:385 (-) Transcript_370:220-1374(-)